MKLYNKISMFLVALLGMFSCAVHDPFSDNMQLGKELPTVVWTLGSSICKAGESTTFLGKYNISAEGGQIDRSEVWAMVVRSQTSSATCKLAPTLGYTLNVLVDDTARSSQMIASYPHKEEYWNGHEYVIQATFPTSVTLSPLSWNSPKQWGESEEAKFELYYPQSFQSDFKEAVIDLLTKDSLYYSDLRHVYVNFDFKTGQFEQLNQKYNVYFPTETETGVKSDLWYTNTKNVIGYYYTTLDASGSVILHEVSKPEDAPVGVALYDVYESSKWVFCRYSDDLGSVITTVRNNWMPYFKDLMSQIPFSEWIYADQSYLVSFARSYKLLPQFRVYTKKGKFGTDTTDAIAIELN